jgi:uncharacterized protein (TIGR00730 family)
VSTTNPDRSPLAYKDEEFLDSEEARPLRILAEYMQPMRALANEGVVGTIVFFGSARIRPGGPMHRFYDEAVELSGLVTQWCEREPALKGCVVCTGGGPGIMEAANRGASEAGGRSVGLNIGLPHEQRPNPHTPRELSFEFHYFFMRKLWFASLARALVVFPGGFGTFDELFEVLTLAQTRKLERSIPVVLYGSDYWNEVVNFEAMVRRGLIDREDLSLFHFADQPATALAVLQMGISAVPEEEAPAFAHSRRPPS